jgi:methylmalonyl-CoA mutase
MSSAHPRAGGERLALIEEVEGMANDESVAEGLPKRASRKRAARGKVDTGETVIVGVNRYRWPKRRR